MLLKVNNVRIPLVEELSLKEATAKKLGGQLMPAVKIISF